uniref:Uncharacterized protein n=1 Tax=Setaria viridis TaxID=4556 RepID=A0A4U6U9S9_SETVI|nr:hypothetical protein SEVIR_6G230750v2 [Setaria viridis]
MLQLVQLLLASCCSCCVASTTERSGAYKMIDFSLVSEFIFQQNMSKCYGEPEALR